jgi:hypothetical protein
VFVLSHDQESAQRARDMFSRFSWAHPYVIPTTYYFETYFYSHILEGIMDQDNVSDAAWIGSISWKADKKVNLDLFDQMLKDPTLDADVIGLWDIIPESLWDFSREVHPGVMEILVHILESIGETKEHINMTRSVAPVFKSFYASFFVARPTHMRSYIQWISKVFQFINSDRKVQNMMWRDSLYDGGDKAVARAVYDLPHYPMHPFLGERLVQYFFNTRGYKIATGCEYMKLKASPHACRYPTTE